MPFQGRANVRHQWMSSIVSGSSERESLRLTTVCAVSMSLLRKMRPAGITLQAKASLPIKDRSCRLEHVRPESGRRLNLRSSSIRAASFSSGRRACMRTVSNSIPKRVRMVLGPMTFSGLRGACTASQRVSMSRRALMSRHRWLMGLQRRSHPGSGRSPRCQSSCG